MEIKFAKNVPEVSEIRDVLRALDLGEVQAQKTGDDSILLRLKFMSEEDHQKVLSVLREKYNEKPFNFAPANSAGRQDKPKEEVKTEVKNQEKTNKELIFEIPGIEKSEEVKQEQNANIQIAPIVLEERFETIGPAVSENLRKRALQAIFGVIAAIITYIAYSFRKVSKPVQSWKYGLSAVIALMHDLIITMGVFSLISYFYGVEVNIPFIVALLTVLGYSVNDTIVVFDRIRENLIRRGTDNFEETVNVGVTQSLTRSINTSLTVLLVLIALFLFGGEAIHYFTLTLIVGITIGTYSSIFLASPFLVIMEKRARK